MMKIIDMTSKMKPKKKVSLVNKQPLLLKPCPFCGSAPKLAHSADNSVSKPSYIVCTNEDCSIMTPMFYLAGRAEAIEKWNSRVVFK